MAKLPFPLEGENRRRTFTCLGPKEPWDGAERQELKGHPCQVFLSYSMLQYTPQERGWRMLIAWAALVSESSWGDRGSPSIDEK